MLARDDITEFTRYRNVPEVARYQEWALPYTRDLAHDHARADRPKAHGGALLRRRLDPQPPLVPCRRQHRADGVGNVSLQLQ